jgi:aldehyde:ferredoxin oxidoreductase
MNHAVNASGLCVSGHFSTRLRMLPDFLTAVTGHAYPLGEIMRCGERSEISRQAHTAREGLNPVRQALSGRAHGLPLPDGPTRDVTVDVEQMGKEFLESMGWTLDGAVPTADRLRSLGLGCIARDLWEPGIQLPAAARKAYQTRRK